MRVDEFVLLHLAGLSSNRMDGVIALLCLINPSMPKKPDDQRD